MQALRFFSGVQPSAVSLDSDFPCSKICEGPKDQAWFPEGISTLKIALRLIEVGLNGLNPNFHVKIRIIFVAILRITLNDVYAVDKKTEL